MLASVFTQFAMHFASLVYLVDQAKYWSSIANATATNLSNATTSNESFDASFSSVAPLQGEEGEREHLAQASPTDNATASASAVNSSLSPTSEKNTSSSPSSFFDSEPFSPNLLNTIVYLLAVLLQLVTFTVNYKVN